MAPAAAPHLSSTPCASRSASTSWRGSSAGAGSRASGSWSAGSRWSCRSARRRCARRCASWRSLRLIESAPNKGVRVRNLTAADLKESYPVRAGLEQVAAELAAERLAEDCSALERRWPRCTRRTRSCDGEAQVRHTVGLPPRAGAGGRATRCCCTRGRRWASRCGRRCRSAGSSPAPTLVRRRAPGARRRLRAPRPGHRRAGQGPCAELRAASAPDHRPGAPVAATASKADQGLTPRAL